MVVLVRTNMKRSNLHMSTLIVVIPSVTLLMLLQKVSTFEPSYSLSTCLVDLLNNVYNYTTSTLIGESCLNNTDSNVNGNVIIV